MFVFFNIANTLKHKVQHSFNSSGHYLCNRIINIITMKSFKKILALSFIGIFAMFFLNAQNSSKTKAQEIADLVNSQKYMFVAQFVSPMSGSTRILTSDYDLTVTKENIIAYLPYFGRAYTAPIGNSDVGIKFTSEKFDYKITPGKKGRKIVDIVTKDAGSSNRLSLTIFSNGNATLDVITSNKQPISYSGYITAIKK
jgi:hypothetical protein